MTTNEQHANALTNAADQYAQHTGTINVSGINVDAQRQATSYRSAAAMLRAADRGITDPDALRAIGRAN